ncbi:unnamed protein product [Bathycoccus prasinos]|jgi:hypothetical protein|tara:strand:- start:760 stop:2334 length:1575 start_codon:yes stop_codon:yes gene_type:complete
MMTLLVNYIKTIFFFSALTHLLSGVKTVSAEVISEIACENSIISVDCGSSKLIKIRDANYGRTDSETCPLEGNAGASKNTACFSTSTFDDVKDSCHGTQSCEMTASNSNFGETCAGTAKYLNVTYECVPDWPIVLSKDGTVGVINGVGEVHVSASEMKVYGNMNVSEGDINIGGYGLSRFDSRIEDIENATATLLQLQTQLENNTKTPPYCMPPGADGLQHNGTDWICGCKENWSGTSCETDALAFDGGDKDNYLLLGECEVIETFIPREAAFMGLSMASEYQGATTTVFDTSKSEQQTENLRTYIAAFQSVDDWCKMVQFEIKKDSKECYYKPLAAGYYRSFDGSESTCTIGNVATGWLSRNYNDLATAKNENGYGIETISFTHPSPPTPPTPPPPVSNSPPIGDCTSGFSEVFASDGGTGMCMYTYGASYPSLCSTNGGGANDEVCANTYSSGDFLYSHSCRVNGAWDEVCIANLCLSSELCTGYQKTALGTTYWLYGGGGTLTYGSYSSVNYKCCQKNVPL